MTMCVEIFLVAFALLFAAELARSMRSSSLIRLEISPDKMIFNETLSFFPSLFSTSDSKLRKIVRTFFHPVQKKEKKVNITFGLGLKLYLIALTSWSACLGMTGKMVARTPATAPRYCAQKDESTPLSSRIPCNPL